MARTKALVATSLLLLAMAAPLAFAGAATAGDVDNPDMEDGRGDSTSGRDSRDLVSGWVGNESETSIEFNLKMAALDPITPFSDWQSLPVVYYEFFFDVTTPGGTTSYSARAMVPVHGPTAAFTQYETMQVNYTSQGTVSEEVSIGGAAGRYVFNAGTIAITVDKALMGDPARGDLLHGIWGRITSTSQRGAADVIVEDTMMNHLSPGKSFVFTGGVTFYSVDLSANVTAANASSDLPASFEVVIHSASEKQANVTLRNSSTLPTNWTLRTDKPLYIVPAGENITAIVTITPGVNQTNQTRRVTIFGEYKDDQNANRTTENAITFTVAIPAIGGPGGGGGGGGGGGAKGDTFPFPGGVYGAAGALGAVVVVLAALFLYVLPKRNAKIARQRYQRMQSRAWSHSPRSGPSAPPAGAPPPRPATPGPRTR